jgi:hypothetical protein
MTFDPRIPYDDLPLLPPGADIESMDLSGRHRAGFCRGAGGHRHGLTPPDCLGAEALAGDGEPRPDWQTVKPGHAGREDARKTQR